MSRTTKSAPISSSLVVGDIREAAARAAREWYEKHPGYFAGNMKMAIAMYLAGYEAAKAEATKPKRLTMDNAAREARNDARSLARCKPCRCGGSAIWGSGFLYCDECGAEFDTVREWNRGNP